ncbi:MAG: helix-turn-helix transcriptional regulator [Alphaproteobacteria bacterium]|nr:helix-turn-helix transcriptional regulator [Alphaproteobacteria bacterium]
MSHDDLDDVWRALANPYRRRILDVLRERPRTTGGLADALQENRFLVMQHLNLLRAAQLVTVETQGRQRINHLNPVPIQQIYERWVGKYQGDWASALVGLKRSVEVKQEGRRKTRRK